MENKFRKNSAFIIPFVLDTNEICTASCLSFVDIERTDTEMYLNMYYKTKSKQQDFWLLSKARKNKSYFNSFMKNINGDVYTVIRFSVKNSALYTANALINTKYKDFNKTIITVSVLFWKEHAYKILEEEETRAARESSPGLFLYLFSFSI